MADAGGALHLHPLGRGSAVAPEPLLQAGGAGEVALGDVYDFAALAVPRGRLCLEVADTVYPQRADGHCREYLYHDGNAPWRDRACLLAYLTRLVRLVEPRP